MDAAPRSIWRFRHHITVSTSGSSRHENVPLRPSPCSEVALASGAVRCLRESTLDEETVRLLRALRESPTDLAKLVKTIHRRRRRVVAIAPKAIARWNRDDPDSWKRVYDWLTRRDVRIVVCRGASVAALFFVTVVLSAGLLFVVQPMV